MVHLLPATRRLIIFALGSIAIAAIVAEVVLMFFDKTTSEALLNLAAVCAGGISGIAVPPPVGKGESDD
jgi:hypothetical protein